MNLKIFPVHRKNKSKYIINIRAFFAKLETIYIVWIMNNFAFNFWAIINSLSKPLGPSMSFYISRVYLDFILILSRFFKNSLYPNFIQILSRFYPDFLKTHFIQISSWFYPNFWKYLNKKYQNLNFKVNFILILSWFYLDFIQILSRFFENSLYPNFILILS